MDPDDGRGEIFLHSSAIVGGGVVVEGQRVAFLVVDGEKGPQADHLLPLAAEAAPAGAAAGSTSDGADGTVSWYDEGKGFGFIAPDAGGDDIFVHVKALGRGLTELPEGARVTFDVVEGDRGPNARNVQIVGGARGGKGTVARYDADRGFGFITPDAGGDDLFVHFSVVRGSEPLYEGDRVSFGIRQSDRGPQADRVELI